MATNKSWKIFWHIFFWLSLISLFIYLAQDDTHMDYKGMTVVFLLYPLINIGLFYLNLLVFIPNFLNKKRYGIYTTIIVAAIVVFGLGKYGLGLEFKSYILMHEKGHVVGFWQYFVGTVFTSLTFVILSTGLKFATDWFNNERIQRDLENQRLTAELSFLKSQINPHFLFNTLNSIYSMALEKSDNTAEAVVKLSAMMRYVLNDADKALVSLEQELNYISSYIELQSIRFGDALPLQYNVIGSLEGKKIAPLILIPFIENAFKHGVNAEADSEIKIEIVVNGNELNMMVVNNKVPLQIPDEHKTGVGIENVKNRLKLLYAGRHVLTITDTDEAFFVALKLKLE